MKIPFFLLISLLFCSWHSETALARHGLALEGISYEDEAPETSIAIINGEILSKGDTSGHYEVLKIRHESVLVKDLETNEEAWVRLGENIPAKETAPPQTMTTEEKETVVESETATSMFKQLLRAIGRVQYTGVLVDLKKIHIAATYEYLDRGPRTLTLADLVKAGHLPDSFSKGEHGGYHFRIDIAERGPQVHANPIDAKPTSKYFLIDGDGFMYIEEGKEATRKSKSYSL